MFTVSCLTVEVVSELRWVSRNMMREIHGWTDETALVKYLIHRSGLREEWGLETVPDQSTLWRTRYERFTTGLHDTIEKAARTILIKAQNGSVAVPRKLERQLPFHSDEEAEPGPDDQAIIDEAASITDHVAASSSQRSH